MTHAFLIIGQSNMAGRGSLDEAEPLDTCEKRLKVLRNGRWQTMYRPVNNDRPFAGTCLAESFAKAYAEEHPDVDVGIIPCADGGTYLDQWQENGLLFDETRDWSMKPVFNLRKNLEFYSGRIAKAFLGNTDTLITSDLHVYSVVTGETYNLIENSPQWRQPQFNPSEIVLHESGKYVILKYSHANAIVDFSARKIIAQYNTETWWGCIVGNEFWETTEAGVLRRPFPLMEELRPPKYKFW